MIKDLREYLEFLKENNWIDVIDEPVELMQISAAMKAQEKKERAVLFNNIIGYEYPLVNNLFGSRDFLAKLFECSIEEVAKVFGERSKGRIKPVLVENAPVQEVVLKAGEFDIGRFPFIVHSAKDAGRYITAGMVIAKDPENGVRKISFNRMQLKVRTKQDFVCRQHRIWKITIRRR